MRAKAALRVIWEKNGQIVYYDPKKPPDVFFDTSVWRGIGDKNIGYLEDIRERRGFCYRYSTTNFVELIAGLGKRELGSERALFAKLKGCFRRIERLCEPDILPSPEMEFLRVVGLEHYIDPAWIPDFKGIALQIRLIANSKNYEDLHRILNVEHYSHLCNTDERSIKALLEELSQFNHPVSSADADKLILWFMKLAEFFLLVRPSNGRLRYRHLKKDERFRFQEAFTKGVGRLFFYHCFSRVRKVVNERMKIDPNDLYDMLQLILLADENRLFVTNDKAFLTYRDQDQEIQRVLPWKGFRNFL